MTHLEKYFETYRKEIVGINNSFNSPYGIKKLDLCRLGCKWKTL